MKLKSFIAKAAVITILAGVVHAPANFLYQDNQKAQWEITEQFNPVRRFKDIPDNQSAQGYLITGGVCFKIQMHWFTLIIIKRQTVKHVLSSFISR